MRFGPLTAATAALGAHVVDLSGDHWTLQNLGLNISIPARLPSQAHLDLLENRVIGDPLYGLNDFALRWVWAQNWTYVAPLTGLRPDVNETWLLFDGLDTFARVSLCGEEVARTDNQFRQWYVDVSRTLARCAGAPLLALEFASAPAVTAAINAEPGRQHWPLAVEQNYTIPNRQWMRKQQSDFGWDWGPAMAPAGPWRPAYAVQLGYGEVHPRNTLVDVYRRGQRNNMIPDQAQPWVVNASVDVLGTLPAGAALAYTLRDEARGVTLRTGQLEQVNATAAVITGATTIPDELVECWWPVGMGAQKLYHLTVDVVAGNRSLASVTKRIGFRTIVLNELPVTAEETARHGIAPGNHWHFEINGRPFFAKGSNLIPPDPFWARVDAKRVRSLFTAVVQGNQNMLRVWASGAYQPDFVYDLADEMGILLWSEFEFGDALYPTDQQFLDNVYEEAVYQVRRINHHPSLAYWAGGNELENLELTTAKMVDPGRYEQYVAEYEKLFLTTLFPAVFENSRSISYAPSSTSKGFISLNFTQAPYMQERYEELARPGEIYGETDYYNYNSSVAFDMDEYPVGRFSNEFGYHSMSSLQTWRDALPESQLSFNSSFIVARNRHPPPGSLNISATDLSLVGMGQMTMAVEQHYPVPQAKDEVANFSLWCWTTQIFQADYYSSQVAFYRRGSGLPQRTLGSLYWQLEDIWQTISWAGIEYGGRWKVLHYRMKDAYQPVIVAPYNNQTTGILSAWVTSDLWTEASGTAWVDWFTWTGEPVSRLPSVSNKAFAVGALNATQVYAFNLTASIEGLDASDLVMRVRIDASGKLPNAGAASQFSHDKWFHAAPLSTAKLVDPGLELSYDAKAKEFAVKASKGVSAWTWLDYPRGAIVRFSDNGFWLAKGETKRIAFELESDDTGGRWLEGVTVQSIWNNTLTTSSSSSS